MSYIPTKNMTLKEWLAIRKKSIGGSDCAAILGYNEYKTPVDVWLEKTASSLIQTPDNNPMRIGRMLEDDVTKFFEEDMGIKVRQDNKIRYHKDIPYFSCNLDGVVSAHDGNPPGTFEAKVIQSRSLDKYATVIPPQYYLQCQHNMNVSGHSYAWISMLILDKYEILHHRIEFNPKVVETMTARLKMFWEQNVENGKCPPPVNEDDLKKLYAESDPTKSVEAPEDIVDVFASLEEAKEKAKEWEAKKKEIEFEIKSLLGEAEVLTFDGDTAATYKTIYRFNPEEFIENNPEIAKEYMTELDTKRLKDERLPLYQKHQTDPAYRRLYTRDLSKD